MFETPHVLIHLKLIYIEDFKKKSFLIDTGNFWEVSNEVLDKIEGIGYLKNKDTQVKYLVSNPSVARRRGINISSYS